MGVCTCTCVRVHNYRSGQGKENDSDWNYLFDKTKIISSVQKINDTSLSIFR